MARSASASLIAVMTGIAAAVAPAPAPTVERPAAPRCQLILENARQPGAMLDVAQCRGKPVVIRGVCPE